MGQRALWDDPDYHAPARADETSQALLRTENSAKFHDGMIAAMLVSAYKYGKLAVAYPERVNAIESLKLRLASYAETGNVEHLISIANYAMIEFMHPAHPEAFYAATDAVGSPGRVAAHTEIYDAPNQFRNSDLADRDEKPF